MKCELRGHRCSVRGFPLAPGCKRIAKIKVAFFSPNPFPRTDVTGMVGRKAFDPLSPKVCAGIRWCIFGSSAYLFIRDHAVAGQHATAVECVEDSIVYQTEAHVDLAQPPA